jgi:hypothetical protein
MQIINHNLSIRVTFKIVLIFSTKYICHCKPMARQSTYFFGWVLERKKICFEKKFQNKKTKVDNHAE